MRDARKPLSTGPSTLIHATFVDAPGLTDSQWHELWFPGVQESSRYMVAGGLSCGIAALSCFKKQWEYIEVDARIGHPKLVPIP